MWDVPRFVEGVTPCSGGDLDLDIDFEASMLTLLTFVIYVVDMVGPPVIKLVSLGFRLRPICFFS